MGLFERREIARDEHAFGPAGVAELLRRPSDVHEHEIGLRVGGFHPAIGEPLRGEVAHGGVARALGGDERRVLLDGGNASVQREDVERARARPRVPVAHLLDRVHVPDRVAEAQAGHAVGLGERPRDDDARVLDGQADVRVVIGIGDVVEVGLVDEDRRLGRLTVDLRQEGTRDRRADVGGRRVVRVAIEDQSRALCRVGDLAEVYLEVGVERHRAHRIPHHLGVARALFIRGDRADERLVLRCEQVSRGPQDLRRSAAEHDVFGLDPVLLRDGLDELAATRRIAARRTAALTERGAHGLHHGLPRAQRILVAAQAGHARRDRLERRLERGPDAVLAAPCADP